MGIPQKRMYKVDRVLDRLLQTLTYIEMLYMLSVEQTDFRSKSLP